MRTAIALCCYIAAMFLVYAGMNVPGSDGLGSHVKPVNDEELLAVLLIVAGMGAKMAGHCFLMFQPR